jgi:hypothetical protein
MFGWLYSKMQDNKQFHTFGTATTMNTGVQQRNLMISKLVTNSMELNTNQETTRC